jgi:hypothetical protein
MIEFHTATTTDESAFHDFLFGISRNVPIDDPRRKILSRPSRRTFQLCYGERGLNRREFTPQFISHASSLNSRIRSRTASIACAQGDFFWPNGGGQDGRSGGRPAAIRGLSSVKISHFKKEAGKIICALPSVCKNSGEFVRGRLDRPAVETLPSPDHSTTVQVTPLFNVPLRVREN